jgi:hypothetical protein
MRILVLVLLFACADKDDARVAKVIATGATPQEAFANYQKALDTRDLDFLWAFVSDKDKSGQIGKLLAPMNAGNVPEARLAELTEGFGVTADELRRMSKPDFDKHFIWMTFGRTAIVVTTQQIKNVTIDGTTAILELTHPRSKLALVQEAGNWHWDLMGTSAANK